MVRQGFEDHAQLAAIAPALFVVLTTDEQAFKVGDRP